jgi:hypothetical protein
MRRIDLNSRLWAIQRNKSGIIIQIDVLEYKFRPVTLKEVYVSC